MCALSQACSAECERALRGWKGTTQSHSPESWCAPHAWPAMGCMMNQLFFCWREWNLHAKYLRLFSLLSKLVAFTSAGWSTLRARVMHLIRCAAGVNGVEDVFSHVCLQICKLIRLLSCEHWTDACRCQGDVPAGNIYTSANVFTRPPQKLFILTLLKL